MCPVGQYVCGLRQKVEAHKANNDDMGMTGVAFYCCPLVPNTD